VEAMLQNILPRIQEWLALYGMKIIAAILIFLIGPCCFRTGRQQCQSGGQAVGENRRLLECLF